MAKRPTAPADASRGNQTKTKATTAAPKVPPAQILDTGLRSGGSRTLDRTKAKSAPLTEAPKQGN